MSRLVFRFNDIPTGKPLYALRRLEEAQFVLALEIRPTIHYGEVVSEKDAWGGAHQRFAPYKSDGKTLSKFRYDPDGYAFFNTLEEAYAEAYRVRKEYCASLTLLVDEYFKAHPAY